MFSKLIGTLFIGGGVVLGAGTHDGPARFGDPTLGLPAQVGSACNIACDFCVDTSKHVAHTGGIRAGDSHGCIGESSCEEAHEVCSPTLNSELVNGARYAALGLLVAELADLERTYPERVLLNEERNAVQLTDCDGNLMANFPVTVEVHASLQAQ